MNQEQVAKEPKVTTKVAVDAGIISASQPEAAQQEIYNQVLQALALLIARGVTEAKIKLTLTSTKNS